MPKVSSVGVIRSGGVLSWARVESMGASPAAVGEGAPQLKAGDVATLILPTSDVFFRTESIPSTDPEEIGSIAANIMESEAPLDPSEMVFTYSVASTSGENSVVLCAAAPIASVEALRAEAGVATSRIRCVGVAALYIAQAASALPAAVAGARQVVLAVESGGKLSLVLLENKRPVLAKSLGSIESIKVASAANAIRLVLLQAEMERGAFAEAPIILMSADSAVRELVSGIAEVLGIRFECVATPSDLDIASIAAKESFGNTTFNLFPRAWSDAIAERRQRNSLIIGIAAAFAVWVVCAVALYGWPWALSVRAKQLGNIEKSLLSQEEGVEEYRKRIRIIENYSNRTYSPLEILRDVCLALPQGVTLKGFRHDGTRREATIEAEAPSPALAYDFDNALKRSKLVTRTDFANGPTERHGLGKTSFTISIKYSGGEKNAPGGVGL